MSVTKYQILILFWTVFGTVAFGQRTINLTIDTSCFVLNASPAINGTLGLYTNICEQLDTLVQEVEIISNQEIIIENALSNFKLVFTPNDSMMPTNLYMVHSNVNNVYLSCYFFNLSYPSFIGQLNENDTLLITSEFIGNTGPLTPLTTHFLKIWRFEDGYYACFATTKRYPNHILLPEDYKVPFGDSILLTKKHIKFIKNFEEGIENLVDNRYNLYHENSLTTIEMNKKTISFYSKGYMSLIIWNELNKTKQLPTKINGIKTGVYSEY